MFKKLKRALSRFQRDERGSITIESVIGLPVIMLGVVGGYGVFDMHREASLNLKATEIVGDILSRETGEITPAYLAAMHSTFNLLARAEPGSALRVSVLRWDAQASQFVAEWSRSTSAETGAISAEHLATLATSLPAQPNYGRIIYVETWAPFTPSIRVMAQGVAGVNGGTIHNATFFTPRFTPQMQWAGG